ncbi:glycosyltransferase family 10 domain-containing protein [Synechococcus sp. Minos11]|uniref:glycosyltransferase family 10 domain-containing protein n=1 Tax=Synechococcus sp. Minos11 TaxID=221341 RepID=UPI0016482BFA|nr:glycosyltransferase family 10 [Synechococcus sp. Minos11]
MKDLRIALDGCYPSFWDTDLVMRTVRSFCSPQKVPLLSQCDLLIRGPFHNGNKKRRVRNKLLRAMDFINPMYKSPLTLHVSSENHTLINYQSFHSSNCLYGIGHEIIKDKNYLRIPHWLNYVDFANNGIFGPSHWPRLGRPIQKAEVSSPIYWNRTAKPSAVFIVSNMTNERQALADSLSKVLPIDGFGKYYNPTISSHSSSGFLKRNLLKNYQYCFCPENSLAPGYYTEKIPESFVCGAIPITYCDSSFVHIDFSTDAFINLNKFIKNNLLEVDDLCSYLADSEVHERLISTPLAAFNLDSKIDQLRSFISLIISQALD